MFMKRMNGIICLAAAVVTLAISQPGCTQDSRHVTGKPNVLLITVDTLRPDYIGCYGSPDVKTPNIDRLAASGVQFMRNVSPSQCTNPSHASILTGLYAGFHGVTDNHTPLTGKAVTLPEVFRQKGYATLGAVSAGHLNPINSNFSQGFETFLQCEPRELNAAEQNKKFLKELERISSVSFFAWVHYFDPHGDYIPPPPYDKMYPVRSEYDPVPPRPEMNLDPKTRSKPVDPDVIIPLYKGEITYVDSRIGNVIGFLKEKKILDNTLIILVADHGESMTEKGIYFCHNGIYNPVIHVPLIMSFPRKLPRGLRVERLTSSVDIFPTVLEILGTGYRPDRINGRSMVRMFSDPGYQPHAFVVGEAAYTALRTIYQEGYKFIKTFPTDGSPGARRLYRGWEDYHESLELTDREPERAKKMETLLETWIKSAKRKGLKSKQRKKLDKKTEETLKSLGYIK
ncbi:MAG: sulfatase [bacterium]|nr:sulfatase [bacterium]